MDLSASLHKALHLNTIQIPVTVEPGSIKWDDIELFRRRFGVLRENLKDLNLGQISFGFSRQPDGRYTGGIDDLPSDFRLKGLYVDFRHFYLHDEPTHIESFANYLMSLSDSDVFRQFIKEEKTRLRSTFLEEGWFEHKGERISTKQFLDVWFNAEIFHNNRGRRGRPWKTQTLLEWTQIFADQTAKSLLFMAVYDSISVIRNISWVVTEFSTSNMHLRMPSNAAKRSSEDGAH